MPYIQGTNTHSYTRSNSHRYTCSQAHEHACAHVCTLRTQGDTNPVQLRRCCFGAHTVICVLWKNCGPRRDRLDQAARLHQDHSRGHHRWLWRQLAQGGVEDAGTRVGSGQVGSHLLLLMLLQLVLETFTPSSRQVPGWEAALSAFSKSLALFVCLFIHPSIHPSSIMFLYWGRPYLLDCCGEQLPDFSSSGIGLTLGSI